MKKNIQKEPRKSSEIDSAFEILKRDINQSFQQRPLHTLTYNAAIKEFQKLYNKTKVKDRIQNEKPNFNTAQEEVITYFLGEDKKLALSTFHSVDPKRPQYRGPYQVSYYLENCSDRFNKEETSLCLWREQSPSLSGTLEKNESSLVILEKIKDLSISYQPEGSSEWITQWDSRTKSNTFPALIRLNLELDSEVKKEWIFSVHFINNSLFTKGLNL